VIFNKIFIRCHTKSVHADAKKVGLQTTQIPKNSLNKPWKLYCMQQLQEKDCGMRTEFKYVFSIGEMSD